MVISVLRRVQSSNRCPPDAITKIQVMSKYVQFVKNGTMLRNGVMVKQGETDADAVSRVVRALEHEHSTRYIGSHWAI